MLLKSYSKVQYLLRMYKLKVYRFTGLLGLLSNDECLWGIDKGKVCRFTMFTGYYKFEHEYRFEEWVYKFTRFTGYTMFLSHQMLTN